MSEDRLRTLAASRSDRLTESASPDYLLTISASAAVDYHDIFLSHSFKDQELVLGLAELFESLGYSVYLDWREDPQLSRERVNRESAQILRQRLKQCSVLLYVPTIHSEESKWMPWELGFMDGRNGKSAIFPIVKHQTSSRSYTGQEYLSLYPYATISRSIKGKNRLWIREAPKIYVSFDRWQRGQLPRAR